MSVEVLLIPAALAGVSAVMAGFSGLGAMFTNDEGRRVCVIQTRLKHPDLLAEALTNLGAEATVDAEGGVYATWDGIPLGFARNADGVIACRFGGDISDARAQEMIDAVDAEYARLVQRQVHQRVRERAADLGMTIESETVDDDENITVVLNVER